MWRLADKFVSTSLFKAETYSVAANAAQQRIKRTKSSALRALSLSLSPFLRGGTIVPSERQSKARRGRERVGEETRNDSRV